MRLTLADLEKERGDVEPFEVDLGDGKVVTLPHPKDMPFESLITFDATKPAAVLRALMGDESFDTFVGDKRITLGVMEQVLEAYYRHFGLGSPGEAAASPASSIGSAGRSRRTSRAKASA